MRSCRRAGGESRSSGIRTVSDVESAARGADVLVIATEWNQFRNLDLEKLKKLLKKPVLVDLRNIYQPERVREAGFTYVGIGQSPGEKWGVCLPDIWGVISWPSRNYWCRRIHSHIYSAISPVLDLIRRDIADRVLVSQFFIHLSINVVNCPKLFG